jgi:26S proteasome regulatory subunit N4
MSLVIAIESRLIFMDTVAHLSPLSTVSMVLEDSPAAASGLQTHDRVLSFGGITQATPDAFQALSQTVAANVDRPLKVVVLRTGTEHALTLWLTPRAWSGRGLLGCVLVPMTS